MADGNEDGAVDPLQKGLPTGVENDDLNGGEIKDGEGIPKAPQVSNKAPVVEPTDEEKAKIAEAEAAEAAKEETPKDGESDEGTDENTDDNTDGEGDLEDYPEYNDESADSVVNLLKESEVTAKEANEWFAEAVESGDLSKIPVDKLVEKLGKDKANLVMLGVKDYYTRTTGAAQESATAVYDEVGGEANWVKVRDWAKALGQANPEFQTQIDEFNKMFDSNKTAATLAAKELVKLYEADTNNSSLSKEVVEGDSSASIGIAEATMTKAQYLPLIKAAEDKRDVREMARLRSVRLASRKAGY